MKEKILQINNEKNIFWTLVLLVIAGFSFYLYCVSVTTLNVVSRQKLEKEIFSIQSTIGSLESEYMSKKNNISIEYAYSLGFKDVSKVTYINKKSLSKTLSFNNEI